MHPWADIEAIEDLLLKVSRLVEEVCRAGLKPSVTLAAGPRLLIIDARLCLKPEKNGMSRSARYRKNAKGQVGPLRSGLLKKK